jgi:atypical dual specificity phosphatase
MGKQLRNPFQSRRSIPSKDDGDDDESKKPPHEENPWTNVTAVVIPQISRLAARTFLGVTLALYVLNQKHCLPRPLSAMVSQALFWPTLPITISRRIGKWITPVDDTVLIGGAPFGFFNYPEKLYKEYGVRGVINLCEEYRGPVRKYKELGMEELHLPTTDHFEPTVDDFLVSSE